MSRSGETQQVEQGPRERVARNVFDWLFGKRRRLYEQLPSEEEIRLFNNSLWQSQVLSEKHRDHLLRWSRVFISEKKWEGCNGLQITDSIQWTVASSAGLLVLAYPDWYYDKTQSILIYQHRISLKWETGVVC